MSPFEVKMFRGDEHEKTISWWGWEGVYLGVCVRRVRREGEGEGLEAESLEGVGLGAGRRETSAGERGESVEVGGGEEGEMMGLGEG